MQNLRNKLIAGGAILTMAALGTVMNRQAAQAQGGPTVTIGAPIPLPVSGTVAVTGNVATAGTVAATQSGPWNVGLTESVQRLRKLGAASFAVRFRWHDV